MFVQLYSQHPHVANTHNYSVCYAWHIESTNNPYSSSRSICTSFKSGTVRWRAPWCIRSSFTTSCRHGSWLWSWYVFSLGPPHTLMQKHWGQFCGLFLLIPSSLHKKWMYRISALVASYTPTLPSQYPNLQLLPPSNSFCKQYRLHLKRRLLPSAASGKWAYNQHQMYEILPSVLLVWVQLDRFGRFWAINFFNSPVTE